MCWHKWNKWEDFATGNTGWYPMPYTEPETRFVTGIWIKQQRACEKCGKKQIQKIEA